MHRILSILITLLLVGMTSAATLCPFQSSETPSTVPAGTVVESMTMASVYGTSFVKQESVWETSTYQMNNTTQYLDRYGLQSSAFSVMSATGTANIMVDTKLSTKFHGLTATAGRALEYAGNRNIGLVFDDSQYFESINGNKTEQKNLACEAVLTGGKGIIQHGAYGSQILGIVSPGNGMTISNGIVTDETVPVRQPGMQGTITVYGSSSQNYGDMKASFKASGTFSGVSVVAHQFKFDSMTE